MISKFDCFLEKNEDSKERKNVYASDVLEMFNAIPWEDDLKKCIQSADEFGGFFSVSYNGSDGLQYSFDTELYIDDENKNENTPLRFSLTYSYQEIKLEKVLFGLLGVKEKVIVENIFMDDQNLDFTLSCLNAFLKQNDEFLRINMYTNFGPETKDQNEKYQ